MPHDGVASVHAGAILSPTHCLPVSPAGAAVAAWVARCRPRAGYGPRGGRARRIESRHSLLAAHESWLRSVHICVCPNSVAWRVCAPNRHLLSPSPFSQRGTQYPRRQATPGASDNIRVPSISRRKAAQQPRQTIAGKARAALTSVALLRRLAVRPLEGRHQEEAPTAGCDHIKPEAFDLRYLHARFSTCFASHI
eukprot:6172030-Pleurochrysis_carterae.AAC.1